jgi:isoquinoline 1-oxidoreductase alpha subunit
MKTITFHLNGHLRQATLDPEMPLLWLLRDHLGLTGTKYGCGAGLCGACTVHVDGVATRSCSVAASAMHGRRVTTIEGLSADGSHPVQRAWRQLNVPQCGYCQSGQMMSAAALLQIQARPSGAQVREALQGHLCRCGTYGRIEQAVHVAAELARREADA